MKKKQLFAGAAVLAMLSAGGVSAATTALAQDYVNDEDGKYASAKTNATVTFEADEDTGTIVDPDDPDDGDEDGGGIDPVDPNENGAELMISYASNLNFGTQSKQGTSWNALADKVYKTDAEGNHVVDEDGEKELKEVTPFVATKDSRGASRKGWSLTVKQDGAFKDGNDELKGAEIVLSGLRYGGDQGAPTPKAEAITVSNEAKEVSNATTEQGIGAWSLALGSLQGEEGAKTTNGVTLNVPSISAKNTGDYSTTVTWELTADPSAAE